MFVSFSPSDNFLFGIFVDFSGSFVDKECLADNGIQFHFGFVCLAMNLLNILM